MKTLTVTALLCLLNLASALAGVKCIGVYYNQAEKMPQPTQFELTRETKIEENVQFFRTKYKDFLYTVSINQEENDISSRISSADNEHGGSDDVSGRGGFGKSGIFESAGAKAGNIMFPSAYVAVHCELEK